MKPQRVAVLGAGLSGLAAARRAQRAGHHVQLFERGPRAGGVVQSELRDGWLVELGPNTVQETPALAALIQELRLSEERVEAAVGTKNRFVVRGGSLRPLPLSPPQFLGGSFFSFGTKVRLLREWLGGKSPPDADSDPSFAAFVRDHFGDEVLAYAAQPFVSGTYAGDPARLSARYAFPRLWQSAAEHGSLLRGQIATAKARQAAGQPVTPPLVSFRSGLAALPRALQAGLAPETLVFGAELTGLRRSPSGWQLLGAPAPWSTAYFDEVIVTLPAQAAARLTIETVPGYSDPSLPRTQPGQASLDSFGEQTESESKSARPLGFLGVVPCPPVTALFAGFRASAVKHALNGFGCLVPAAEKREILGILFSSSLFPGRAPEGHVALTVMLGGALQPANARASAREAWALARHDVQSLLGISEEPVFAEATHYPQAIPQYNVGYGRILDAIAAFEDSFPGLRLAGNYRHGISVPDCLAVLGGARPPGALAR